MERALDRANHLSGSADEVDPVFDDLGDPEEPAELDTVVDEEGWDEEDEDGAGDDAEE